jgi:hypothetical protein
MNKHIGTRRNDQRCRRSIAPYGLGALTPTNPAIVTTSETSNFAVLVVIRAILLFVFWIELWRAETLSGTLTLTLATRYGFRNYDLERSEQTKLNEQRGRYVAIP